MNQPITSGSLKNAQPAVTSVRIKVKTGQRIQLRSSSSGVVQSLTGGVETIGIPQTIDGVDRVLFPEYSAAPTVAVLQKWWEDDLIDIFKRLSTGEEEEYFYD